MATEDAIVVEAFRLGTKRQALTGDEANRAQELLRWLVRDRWRLVEVASGSGLAAGGSGDGRSGMNNAPRGATDTKGD